MCGGDECESRRKIHDNPDGALRDRRRRGCLLGGGGAFEPKPDTFTLRAGRVQSLDVLLNDLNNDRVDPAQLTLVEQPSCGMALVTNGAVQYSSTDNCSGKVTLSYCVPYEEACQTVPITLTILAEQLEVYLGENGLAYTDRRSSST